MHEYVTRYDYTFLTGAPGSRWSGIGQIITENFNYNTKDETDWRVYRHGDFSGHTGSILVLVWNLVMTFIDWKQDMEMI